MQNKNVNESSSWSGVTTNTLSGTVTTSSGVSSCQTLALACSPMVYGNHININLHSYVKTTSSFMSGYRYYFPDVPKPTISVIKGDWSQASSLASLLSSDGLKADTLAYNDAVSKLYDKLRGGADLSIDAVQGKSTAAMLKRPLGSLLDNALKARGVAGQSARAISGTWLAYQYGWRPILAEIYEIVGRIGFKDPNKPPILWYYGRSKQSADDVFEQSFLNFPNRVSVEITHKYRLGVAVSIHDETAIQMLGHYTSLNPASIAWEAMPFSFVYDWLQDIGGFLRSVESAFLYNSIFVRGFNSHITVEETKHQCYGQPLTPNYRGFSTFKGNTKTVRFSRIAMGGMPFPRMPPVHLDMGAARVTSAAALLIQALTGKKR